MKKIAIITGLLASSLILTGCINESETNKDTNIGATNLEAVNTGEEISLEEIAAMPETIKNESGDIIILTGEKTVTNQIKELIETRKAEMAIEKENTDKLNEKDIEFLEAVLEKIAQKK